VPGLYWGNLSSSAPYDGTAKAHAPRAKSFGALSVLSVHERLSEQRPDLSGGFQRETLDKLMIRHENLRSLDPFFNL
jgi:hypothetical protein